MNYYQSKTSEKVIATGGKLRENYVFTSFLSYIPNYSSIFIKTGVARCEHS